MGAADFGNWVLGNFATVEEVRAAIASVVLVPVMVEAIKQPAPMHFIVFDRSGKSIVIEPVDGTLKVYDDPVGVLTNSPDFGWHATNLRNYVNLSPTNLPAVQVGGASVQQFGQGSGMLGLPGDFTPPSRFIRAVAFTQSAIPAATAGEAVLQAFHILNAFDIPVGAVREQHDGDLHTDYTIWSSVADLQDLRWSFRTYTDQSIRTVDLREALSAAEGKVRRISIEFGPAGRQYLHTVQVNSPFGSFAIPQIDRRPFLVGAALAIVPTPGRPHRNSRYGRCMAVPAATSWADRFVAAGFAPRCTNRRSRPIRTAAGVPAELGGCHTAKIEGYVIEGHVPVAAVHRLLAERSAVVGIAVPGMPIGSPGMEIAGRPADPYDVIAFAAGGDRYLFMAVRP